MKKRTYGIALGITGIAIAWWAGTDTHEVPILSSAVPAAVASTEHRYAQLPMAFERNVGQTDDEVLFLARGAGYGVFLTATEAVLSLTSQNPSTGASAGTSHSAVVRMSLLGADSEPVVEGAGAQSGKSHYYYGSTPNRWVRDVRRYDQVRYRGVYPGIDLVYYGNQQQLEYDFVVAPGRNPDRIDVKFTGVDAIRLDRDGNLVLETVSGSLIQHKPVLYQLVDGRRRPVSGGYKLLGDNRVGFQVAAYDGTKPLVIDPVLGYSSYFGGGGDDGIASLFVGDAGSLYAIGATASINFPLKGALQSSNRGSGDVFVTKFNADGRSLLYSTYIGGGNADNGTGIVADGSGNAYITGHTKSTNFPVANALQGSHAADGGLEDAFVAKLGASGTLAFSTYLGGAGADKGLAIDLDPAGNPYVAGSTESGNFPRAAAMDTSLGGTRDGFLAKLTPSGNALTFSTYLGGAGNDHIAGLSIDQSPARAGRIYLAGETSSTDFPVTSSAVQSTLAGGSDAFVSVLRPIAAAPYVALDFGTYLGSALADAGADVDVDADGNAVVVGQTLATSASPFPTANPWQSVNAGGSDGFVAKITLGTEPVLAYSTYLGGSSDDRLESVAIDGYGTAYVVGTTGSNNVIGTSSVFGLQHVSGGGNDAMAARYGDDGERYWVSYLGGSGSEQGAAIALHGSGGIFFGGSTTSTNFPTLSPYKSSTAGAADAFVTRFGVRSLRTTVRNFDGDKNDDILWRNASTGANKVWRSAKSTTATELVKATTAWKVAGTGDFDGNARTDILWRNTSTGANGIWRGGLYSNRSALQTLPDQRWQAAGIGDFNLDGKSDIVWRHGGTGTNMIWLSGNHATQRNMRDVTDPAWKIVGVGDFDGDYVSDILWRNSSTGANTIWLSANYSTPKTVTGVTNQSWRVAGIGDFLGDGESDVLWLDAATRKTVIWRSGDSSRQSFVRTADPGFAIRTVGDYDGDGRSDILLRNEATGENVLWRSGSSANRVVLTSVAGRAWNVVP